MKRHAKQFSLIILVAGSLLLGACKDQPDTGHVGPVGPQALTGTPPANLTVIEDSGVVVTEEHPFAGFTRVEISDAFDVQIRQGQTFRVVTHLEDNATPYVQVYQEGDTLKIMLEPDRAYHMVNVTMDVELTLPQLTRLLLEDGSEATVNGFGDRFEAEVDFLSTLHRE